MKFICKGSEVPLSIDCIPRRLEVKAEVDLPRECPYGLKHPQWKEVKNA